MATVLCVIDVIFEEHLQNGKQERTLFSLLLMKIRQLWKIQVGTIKDHCNNLSLNVQKKLHKNEYMLWTIKHLER